VAEEQAVWGLSLLAKKQHHHDHALWKKRQGTSNQSHHGITHIQHHLSTASHASIQGSYLGNRKEEALFEGLGEGLLKSLHSSPTR